MSDIFISYRRQDSDAYAGRLYDRLAARFDKARIFMDIDMDLGIDFANEIEQRVGSCKVLVAVIGRSWLEVKDGEDRRRLDDPNDWVRLEIVAALERNIPVIPALVGGARMPAASDLPDQVSRLTRRQAIEITHTGFHADVDRLIRGLEKILATEEKKTEKAAAQGRAESPTTPVEPSKPRPKVPTILIASSSELEEDRDELTAYLAMNPALMVVRWAGFLDAMSGTDIEQNIEALRDYDIFVGLFSTNVGRFVGKEFDAALREFRDKKRPHIFVYFKDANVKIHRDDLTLLMALQGKLSHLHHFWQTYKSIDHLKLQLRRELERLVEERPDRFLDTL